MVVTGSSPWRTVLDLAGRPRVALIMAQMLLVGLTEGVGLLLLVPILESLDQADASSGIVGRLLPLGAC